MIGFSQLAQVSRPADGGKVMERNPADDGASAQDETAARERGDSFDDAMQARAGQDQDSPRADAKSDGAKSDGAKNTDAKSSDIDKSSDITAKAERGAEEMTLAEKLAASQVVADEQAQAELPEATDEIETTENAALAGVGPLTKAAHDQAEIGQDEPVSPSGEELEEELPASEAGQTPLAAPQADATHAAQSGKLQAEGPQARSNDGGSRADLDGSNLGGAGLADAEQGDSPEATNLGGAQASASQTNSTLTSASQGNTAQSGAVASFAQALDSRPDPALSSALPAASVAVDAASSTANAASASQAQTPASAPAALTQQLSTAILANPAQDKIELRLDPAELGRVSIEMSFENDRVNVVMRAERADALDLMRRHGEDLRRELAEQGLSLGDMSFGSFSDQASFAEQQQQEQPDYAPHKIALSPQLTAAAETLNIGTGGLDLRL